MDLDLTRVAQDRLGEPKVPQRGLGRHKRRVHEAARETHADEIETQFPRRLPFDDAQLLAI